MEFFSCKLFPIIINITSLFLKRETGQEGYIHLQEDRQQGRYFFKAKLHPYRTRSASSGIQPKISRAKGKTVKVTRRIQTIGRAMLLDLLRKMKDKKLKPHVDTLLNSTSILFQQKYDKDKFYSLHEFQIVYIAKGKAHKRYEFGTKVSIAKTRDRRVIHEALGLPGNTYDGDTFDARLKQLKRISGTQPDILIANRGYRGGKDFGKTQILTPILPAQDYTEYKKRNQRKRAGIQATIGYLKQDFRLGKCLLMKV